MGADRAAGGAGRAVPSLLAAIDDLRASQPLPGGVLVACDRAGTLLTLPFGLADRGCGTPVTERHLFEIGSISKFLASVVVNQLVDEGRMDLAAPVRSYLPWIDFGPHTADITVAHLLGHTAGLVSGADAWTGELAQAWSLRRRAAVPPGRFHYSNAGYVVLGLLIGAVSGVPHAERLRRSVFDPLGIDNGLTRIRNADRPRLAVGYCPAVDDVPWLPGDPLAPAPWLEAPAADGNVALDAPGLSALLRLLLGDGAVGGVRVLGPAAMRRICTILSPGGEPVPTVGDHLEVTRSRYGLGINVEMIAGATCLTHGGGMVGYASFVLADPERDLAVGVLTNADGDCPAAQVLARFAHRAILAASAGRPVPAESPLHPADLAALAGPAAWTGLCGTDVHGRQVRLEVQVDAASRRLVCRTGDGSGTVFRDLHGRFATDHPALRSVHLHRVGEDRPDPGTGPALERMTGHFRSHNPWFSNFRIVRRGGLLVLTAATGVEAPAEDVPLLPAGPGCFRLGGQPECPETLRRVADVDGRAVLLELDGCSYSRSAC